MMTPLSSIKSRLEKRTVLEKYMISILLLFTFVIIGLIIAVSIRPEKKDALCETSACYTVGSSIRNSLDLNIDPCKDFYSYCCGGWEKSHQIPKDINTYGAIQEIQLKVLLQLKDLLENNVNDGIAIKNMVKFYNSCMNTAVIEDSNASSLLHLLKAIGGWPIIDEKWSAKNYNLLSALANIQLKTSYGYILPVIIATDPKNTTRKLLQIDQPTLIVSEDILRKPNEDSSKRELKNFYNFFSKIVQLLGATKNIKTEYDNIIYLEMKMLQMMSSQENMNNVDYWYNNMSISVLQKIVPKINWIRHFQEFTNSSLLKLPKGSEISDEDIVIVRDIPYVKFIAEYLSNEKNSRQIATYLGWRVITSLMTHLPSNFSNALQEYYQDSGYPLQTSERWKTCIKRINTVFSEAVASIYVKQYFSKEVQNEVRKLILDISFQFENRIMDSDWMDRRTKNAALEKLRAMKVNVGYPDWITDEKKLNDDYMKNDIPIMGDDIFENDVKLTEHRTMQVIKYLRMSPDKEEWPISPITINAAYNRNLNSITFPAAFLQLPLYDSSLPSYFNYAAIGSIIGHEITHGFDSEGSKRNASGEICNWWSNETKQIFENKTTCFISQYNSSGMNGKRTLAENIADNGGLQHAHAAFLSWRKKQASYLKLPGLENFSIDQLFFISYGSMWCTKYSPGVFDYIMREAEHAPSLYRLKLTTANLKAFSHSFNCAMSSSAYQNHCSIW